MVSNRGHRYDVVLCRVCHRWIASSRLGFHVETSHRNDPLRLHTDSVNQFFGDPPARIRLDRNMFDEMDEETKEAYIAEALRVTGKPAGSSDVSGAKPSFSLAPFPESGPAERGPGRRDALVWCHACRKWIHHNRQKPHARTHSEGGKGIYFRNPFKEGKAGYASLRYGVPGYDDALKNPYKYIAPQGSEKPEPRLYPEPYEGDSLNPRFFPMDSSLAKDESAPRDGLANYLYVGGLLGPSLSCPIPNKAELVRITKNGVVVLIRWAE